MLDAFENLFSSSPFMAHGHCYLWNSELVWLHVSADSLIAFSYYSIPVTLVYFVQKRKDLPFDWIFLLFGSFIILCGTTHLMEIWTLWHPTYWTAGFLKAFTALVSIGTAASLIPLIPKALALPSPAQLEAANLALGQEVVERKRAEEYVTTLNSELEKRVQERTQELSQTNAELKFEINQRQLAQDKLKVYTLQLEQSNRELQDFAFVASHDLQEPLRKIQAFGDRLKSKYSEVLAEQGRDYLERMQGASNRMQTLIEDLLNFSRVTTKAQPFVAVNLNQVLKGVLSDLETRIEQVGGKVEFGDLLTIEADPSQMRQIIQNLISNALKFHQPNCPPVVKIDSKIITKDGQNLCEIRIADNGIGFDEKYLDRIFIVFQRLHGRSEYEGTGIGLAICRKIVERHSGSITATSTPSQGSTFIITLPVNQPSSSALE